MEAKNILLIGIICLIIFLIIILITDHKNDLKKCLESQNHWFEELSENKSNCCYERIDKFRGIYSKNTYCEWIDT